VGRLAGPSGCSLSADPLADIANIKKVTTVMKEGRIVDRARLPQVRVLSIAPASSAPSQ
jgi:hypothetical protein